MSPFLHPTRLEYEVVKRLKCDCYKVDYVNVLKVMSQEPKTASVESTFAGFFLLFISQEMRKKKNPLTTQLAAIGRFSHGFFCLFVCLFVVKLGPNYSLSYLLFNKHERERYLL